MFQEIYIIDCENELVMMLREKFEQEFEQILAFVDEIAALDLQESLEKDSPIGLGQLREDIPCQSMSQKEVLANAPKQKDGCYVTPQVVE